MADWRARLRGIFQQDARSKDAEAGRVSERPMDAAAFIKGTVAVAFETLERELRQYGREAVIEVGNNEASITVLHEGEAEFSYAVRVRTVKKMTFAFPEIEEEPDVSSQRAVTEVLVNGDVQEQRPVERFTEDGIIADFIDQYSKWMGW